MGQVYIVDGGGGDEYAEKEHGILHIIKKLWAKKVNYLISLG